MHKSRLIYNSISGVIQLTLTAALSLISIPIFIHKLGYDLYGVYALVSVVNSIGIFANFGLSGALLINISKQGKNKQSNYDILTSIITIAILICIITSVMYLFKYAIVSTILSVPVQFENQAITLFVKLILANAILILGQVFTTILDSQQKVYLTNLCQFIYSLVYWISIIITLIYGGNLSHIGNCVLIAALIFFLLVFNIASKVWGKFEFSELPKYFVNSFKKQTAFGSKIYLTSLIAFFFEPLSKIMLSHYSGLNIVGLFDIGLKIKSQINALISKALYPLYPYIAAQKTSISLKSILYDFSNKIFTFILPISIILMFIFPYLIRFWLGQNGSYETVIFISVMTLSMLIFSPSMIPIYQFLLAKNHADKTIVIQSSSAIINILSFLAIKDIFGTYSILVSNSLAFFSSYIICNFYQIRYFDISLRKILNFHFKVLPFIFIGITINGIIFYYKRITITDLFIYPFIIYILFVIYIYLVPVFTLHDSQFYFGSNNRFMLLVNKIFFIKNRDF